MRPGRTVWVGALLLVVLAVGAAAALRWPSAHDALDCEPGRVEWVDGGTGSYARCAPAAAGGGMAVGEGPAGQALTVGRRLNLNRVSAEDLSLVSGVGPQLAARLVEERELLGGFESWEQVGEVRGVGPARLQALMQAFELGP